jgi:excisionase family DNA binding protein
VRGLLVAIETDPGPLGPKLYTVEEVADLCRCGKDYIYDLARERVVPFTRIGRRVLFSEDHLRSLIEHFERPAVKR